MIMWIIIGVTAALLYRHYAVLAFEYHKQRTGFGLLGGGIFIAAYLIFALLLGIVIALVNPELLSDTVTIFVFELGAIGIAAGITAIVRSLLKKSWEKKRAASEILDGK